MKRVLLIQLVVLHFLTSSGFSNPLTNVNELLEMAVSNKLPETVVIAGRICGYNDSRELYLTIVQESKPKKVEIDLVFEDECYFWAYAKYNGRYAEVKGKPITSFTGADVLKATELGSAAIILRGAEVLSLGDAVEVPLNKILESPKEYHLSSLQTRGFLGNSPYVGYLFESRTAASEGDLTRAISIGPRFISSSWQTGEGRSTTKVLVVSGIFRSYPDSPDYRHAPNGEINDTWQYEHIDASEEDK